MIPYINISSLGLSEYMICQFSNGTTCPTAIFCPNTLIHLICNSDIQRGFTIWLLPNVTCTNREYTERIVLLQPKYGGCNPSSTSQHGTCGPFTAQNVASSGCVNSSLSVVATQGLNGTEIKCMNYDGSSYFPVATVLSTNLIMKTYIKMISLMLTALEQSLSYNQLPLVISVISPGCTKIEVQWSMSSVSSRRTYTNCYCQNGIKCYPKC